MPTRRPAQLRRLAALAALGVLLSAPAAQADDILRIANGIPEIAPLIRGVKVSRIDNGRLFYIERGGVERSLDLASVYHIATPIDPAFTQADLAFATQEWAKAIDGYERALRGAEAWKVRWAAPRLLVAADRADRFDVALPAYVATARVDPASAARSKPKLPERPSKYLDEAARTLDAAAKVARSDAERQALLAWLVDVQRARGDQPGIDAAINRLADAAAPTPAPAPSLTAPPATPGAAAIGSLPSVAPPPIAVASPNLPPAEAAAAQAAALAVGADARLTQARAALAAGRFEDVAAAIAAAKPMLVKSDQQAEALALVARARSAAADAAGDADGRRDAALAWLRLVAHFNADPAAAPLVEEAMLDAARQQADVGDVAAARSLYEQLVAERPETPAAATAARRLAKLPGSGS